MHARQGVLNQNHVRTTMKKSSSICSPASIFVRSVLHRKHRSLFCQKNTVRLDWPGFQLLASLLMRSSLILSSDTSVDLEPLDAVWLLSRFSDEDSTGFTEIYSNQKKKKWKFLHNVMIKNGMYNMIEHKRYSKRLFQCQLFVQ